MPAPEPTAVDVRALTVLPVPHMGTEDVLVTAQGEGITGTEDGSIFLVTADGSSVRRLGSSGGRPMGLEHMPDGRILVCDVRRGLLALDIGTGHVETILEEVAGERMMFCNNAAVASDGTIYFSDSSRRYSLEQWRADVAEDTRTGRLMRLQPSSSGGWGEPEVLVDGLRFANGVALARDESFVCVAESTGRTLVRRWLSGPRRGEVEAMVPDLPGYPDNVARGSDGLLWVPITSPPNALLERAVHRAPRLLRRLVARLPQALQPAPEATVRVMAFDDTGAVVHDISCAPEQFSFVTGVREHDGRVWLGSLHQAAVAYFDL